MRASPENDHQVLFFEEIKRGFSSANESMDKICRILCVERSALYNRVSGQKRLSVDEALRLSRHFGVPYPGLTEAQLPAGTVGVRLAALAGQPNGAVEFLRPLSNQLEQFAQIPDVVIHYVTSEIPFFYFLHFPRLARFKFYVWTYFTWSGAGYGGERKPYDAQNLPESEARLYSTVRQAYDQFSGDEIWHVNILDNTLNQLIYLHHVGLLTTQDAELLLVDLFNLLEMVSLRAELGIKANDTTYNLYQNEVTHTNNLVLVEAGKQSSVFFTYDNPNLCSSSDPLLITYTRDAIRRLLRNCTSIAHGSDRQRRIFFNQLVQRIEITRKRIKNAAAR